MNQTNVKKIIGDFLIVVLFAILPGIRGYSNWQIHEYLIIAVIAGIILYHRHTKTQKPNKSNSYSIKR
jgi:hypothetical protein